MPNNSEELKITVLCTVYNGENYFERAIPSILNQTYKNFDFLIINDGSTDNTLKRLLQLEKEDKRIRVIDSGRIGRVEALNLGVKESETDLIAIQDFDDISYSERLEKQVEFMLQNEEVVWLGGAGKSINVIRDEIRINYYPELHEEIVKYMAQSVPYDHTTVMFKRSAILSVGGYSDEVGGIEDFWIGIRLVKQGFKMANLQYVLGEHYEHSESYWNKNFSYMLRQKKIQKLQLYAIKEFRLPFWLYVFPIGRLIYGYLPNGIKRLLRKMSGSLEEKV